MVLAGVALTADEEVALAKRIEADRDAVRELHAAIALGRAPGRRRRELEARIAVEKFDWRRGPKNEAPADEVVERLFVERGVRRGAATTA